MSMALLDAIGYVDDEFIDEAERELPQSSTRHIRWLPAAACAAVCAVMVWALGTRSVPEMGPGGADEQAWEESTVIEKVPVQTEKTQEISTESLSAGYCVTIRIEEEKDGIITGTVTAVKGLESIGVGDRIQVDRTKECKSYNYDYDRIGPEPMFTFRESEGARYLQIQSEERELAERYVELLP